MNNVIICGIALVILVALIAFIRSTRQVPYGDDSDEDTKRDDKAYEIVRGIKRRNLVESIATSVALFMFAGLCFSAWFLIHGWYVNIKTPQKEYYHREVRIETQAKIQPPHQAYVPKAYRTQYPENSFQSGSSTIAWSPVGNHTFKQKKVDYRPETSAGATGNNGQNNDLSF